MRQPVILGRSLPWLGESPSRGRASTSAIMAPPPGPGEVRRTALPDTFDGIRFEIGRMIRYIQGACEDPIIVANTEALCGRHIQGMEWSARMNGLSLDGIDPRDVCVEAIDDWCRAHFAYVNDPPNIEVIQTPRRMIQITRVPPEVIRHVCAPFLEAMRSVAGGAAVDSYEPPAVCAGDCDEGALFFLSHCAACRRALLDRLMLDFGGHGGTIHHVWGGVEIDGRHIASDLTEPDYALGDFSKFPHYEAVEVPLGAKGRREKMGTRLGVGYVGEAETETERAAAELPPDIRRMAEKIAAGRKDAVLVDCARLLGVHYGKMVEQFSALENRPVSAHNNKTLFLEGIDLWCRTYFGSGYPRSGGPSTEDPREVIAHIMRPWYEALELEDPSRYRMPDQEPPPAYKGSPEDATCAALALSGCLDITPINLAFGMRDGRPERMWGRVSADGNWYDSDVNEPFFVLGDKPEYGKVEEFEVPL